MRAIKSSGKNWATTFLYEPTGSNVHRAWDAYKGRKKESRTEASPSESSQPSSGAGRDSAPRPHLLEGSLKHARVFLHSVTAAKSILNQGHAEPPMVMGPQSSISNAPSAKAMGGKLVPKEGNHPKAPFICGHEDSSSQLPPNNRSSLGLNNPGQRDINGRPARSVTTAIPTASEKHIPPPHTWGVPSFSMISL